MNPAQPSARYAPVWAALLAGVMVVSIAGRAAACPFCDAQEPSLAERTAGATRAALAETASVDAQGTATFRVLKSLAGDWAGQTAFTAPVKSLRAGDLCLAVGVTAEPGEPAGKLPAKLDWTFEKLDEPAFAYVARLPSRKSPALERLRYYARFLEHASPLIAQDAYAEFAQASFSEVAEVAEAVPAARLRTWIEAADVPERRKGLYGLLLGLSAKARRDLAARDPLAPRDSLADRDYLAALIEKPAADFRAGFDGILGGYLAAAGSDGLALVETRFLANPEAAEGDVRHALRALEFCWEFERSISRQKLAGALRRLLARPEFARQTIVQLARWQDWESLERIVGLYTQPAYQDPATQRAIIGFVLSSPQAAAATALEKLRRLDPDRVSETEKQFSVLGGVR